ncbi:MAG: lysophospholipid acyltransferase family protein [Roseovarius sp.]
MTFTWSPETEPPAFRITPAGWLRAVLRGTALLLVLLAGVTATLLLRPVERALHGPARPWTPFLTQGVSRSVFLILGMRHEATGQRMTERGAVVANHASWLDIFALNARKRVYFVSKAEVAGWPGIGFLARLTGTVFIARDPRQAQAQQSLFEERLIAGHKLLFFPEGTSTDGMRVLPFKSTLFQAFFNPVLGEGMHVQPVTVIYTAPKGQDPRFYGWWGEMDFGPHLLRVLAVRRNGAVRIVYHPPLRVADFGSRKALAKTAEDTVRAGMPPERQVSGGGASGGSI